MIRRRGLAAEGAVRALRQQGVFWWIFGTGLALAALGSLPLRSAAGGLLDHSRAAAGIAGRLDIPTLAEALSRPSLATGPLAGSAFVLDAVYFVFLLFATGGTLVAYRADRRLSRSEFFETCGRYFWRLVRLWLLSLVPLALVAAVLAGTGAFGRRVAERSPLESHAIAVHLAGLGLAALLFLCVRLWFDVAQARLVVDDERAMWRTALRALRAAGPALGSLFALYAGVGVVVIAAYALGGWLWLRVPPDAFWLSFLVAQAVLLVQLAGRLWLRASVVAWYAARVHTAVPSTERVEPSRPLDAVEQPAAEPAATA